MGDMTTFQVLKLCLNSCCSFSPIPYKFWEGSRIWKIIYWGAWGFLTGNWTNCSENIRPGRFVSKMAWPVAFLMIFIANIGASVISTVYRGSLWPSDESVIYWSCSLTTFWWENLYRNFKSLYTFRFKTHLKINDVENGGMSSLPLILCHFLLWSSTAGYKSRHQKVSSSWAKFLTRASFIHFHL